MSLENSGSRESRTVLKFVTCPACGFDPCRGEGCTSQSAIPGAPVTGEQVRDAMTVAGIDEVKHHDCAICGEWTYYIRRHDRLFYSSGCGCSWSEPRPRHWSDAADWINEQANKSVRIDLLRRFGFPSNPS
ncbi:hypothetical protein [Nevskia ramosa]|uniref:hypothetical protein n=1 Tax=Nevskia ramosa TaxID=64002 RepID=UPI002357E646|nr:hypothetical protein [Nevskia ramosa]